MMKFSLIFTRKTLLVLGIIFVAFNLRAPLAYVSPLVSLIKTDLGISNAGVGIMMTLPLLLFAFLSPIATRLGIRLGNELAIFIGLIILTIGEFIRPLGTAENLFLGTALIGIGIAISNVLIPSIIKHKFSNKIGLMTSIYTTSTTVFAAIGSGVSEPMTNSLQLGWRNSLMFLGLLTVITLLIWLPQLHDHHKSMQIEITNPSVKSIWHSYLAWQVAMFLGLQSCLIFTLVAWLPEILRSYGISTSSAGWLFSFFQLASMPTSFLAPIIAVRFHDQRKITAVFCMVSLVGTVGLLAGGNIVMLTIWLTLLAAGVGACLSLAFTFIGLRTTDKTQAAELSGMSQFVGYLLAASGPFLVGLMYDFTQSWTLPLLLLIGINLAMFGFGLGAGRDLYVFQKNRKYVSQ